MARLDVNRSGEIEVFARVVELGGFSAAARAFRMTPSAVSKLVARLEARLGVRLVNRSTRKLQLTAEGAAFYERGVRILSDMDAAEQEASAGAAPRGRLRINTNVAFGYGFLLPLMPGFLEAHPGVTVDITLTDTVVDLLEERADIAIRVGPLRDSSMMTRKLGESRNVVVASPDYLKKHGVPCTLDELMQHNRLGFSFTRIYEGWPFMNASGEIVRVPPAGNTLISDGDAMRHLALAGLGVGRLSAFHVNADIADGKLVVILEDLNPGDISPITAIFAGQSGYVPARVRALLDYLVENVKLD